MADRLASLSQDGQYQPRAIAPARFVTAWRGAHSERGFVKPGIKQPDRHVHRVDCEDQVFHAGLRGLQVVGYLLALAK
jgi:hypothetical protein